MVVEALLLENVRRFFVRQPTERYAGNGNDSISDDGK
jgi:hypothetical protein